MLRLFILNLTDNQRNPFNSYQLSVVSFVAGFKPLLYSYQLSAIVEHQELVTDLNSPPYA
ncbi:MAG: hypothetical protein RMY36_025000 [Nostoc sp. SerVER01]|nr:hypothetical protein [Nostoc sp. SerVER01]MDZ8081234.1 hypothetical protein [Nostoc sp. DcaGUA01]MDZ8240950.1 hypothetical protein [Nostoc sp. ChiQUE01a]